MKISYLGHSCFYLQGNEYSVVTDPFGGIGYELKRVECDYAISSHGHFDHNNFSGVDCRVRVTDSIDGFEGIDTFHDEAFGAKRGKNKVFYFTLDGVRVMHLGDFGEPFCEESLKKILRPVDVLFIPVGGVYTIDALTAYEYAEAIGAKITVPMHFNTGDCTVEVGPVEEFLKHFKSIERAEGEFELDADDIKGDAKVVYVTKI